MTSSSQLYQRAEVNVDNVRDTIKEIIAMLSGETFLKKNTNHSKTENKTTLNIQKEIDVMVRRDQLCTSFTKLVKLEQ